MLAHNNKRWLTFCIILLIKDHIDSEMNVSITQRVFFVSETCIIIGFINIIVCAFKVVKKTSELTFIQSLLQLLQKDFCIFGLGGIRIKTII